MSDDTHRRVIDHLTAPMAPAVRRAVRASIQVDDRSPLLDQLRLTVRRCVRAESRSTGRPVVHAAALSLDGRGVLLPAGSRSGKSTLTLALGCHRGAQIVSDDLVVVDGCRAIGSGAPVSVRRDTPMAERVASLWYADTSDRLLVRLDDLGVDPADAVEVDVLIFPRYDAADEVGRRRRLNAAEAFGRLLSSIVFSVDADALLELALLCARSVVAEISYPSTDVSLALLDAVLADVPSDPNATVSAVPPEEFDSPDDQLIGFRFSGDQVVVLHRLRTEGVVLDGWPAGQVLRVSSWSALTAAAH